jgi:hypothetical protein
MKRESGMKGRGDRSRGMEALNAEALAKIEPTDPLRLAKQAARIDCDAGAVVLGL